MPPTSTEELYSTIELVRVPVGNERFLQKNRICSFEQLKMKVEVESADNVENLENRSWELKTYEHWGNQPNPGKHRPMKINKQPRMLMLKKEKRKTLMNCCELLR